MIESIITADRSFLDEVYQAAMRAGAEGNIPVAALVAAGPAILSLATNRCRVPVVHPGRHAEIEALRAVPEPFWQVSETLMLYTSLEPCLMCFGAIVMHRLGRVVFAASDPVGGALGLMPALPRYVRDKALSILWSGPADPDRFAGLASRALALRSSLDPPES